jgi:hypothetical protein
MTGKNFVSRVLLAAVFFEMLTPPHALGGSAAIGTIAGGLDTTMGGEAVQPNTLVFGGDTLRVAEGAAVVAMNTGSRVVLGQRTAASFLRVPGEVVVLLEQGNVSLYHPGSAEPLRLRLGALSVGPARGFDTFGDVAVLHDVAVVTAKEGILRLERNGSAVEVRKGQTVTVSTKVAGAPQGAPSAGAGVPPPQHGVGSSSLLAWVGITAGAVGAIFGIVGYSSGNNATSKANQAIAASSAAASVATTATMTAQAAASAAAAASTAAVAATSAAVAAGAAAAAAGNAAVEAALIGEAAANIVGCDLNRYANAQGQPSPYTPFTGFTCH